MKTLFLLPDSLTYFLSMLPVFSLPAVTLLLCYMTSCWGPFFANVQIVTSVCQCIGTGLQAHTVLRVRYYTHFIHIPQDWAVYLLLSPGTALVGCIEVLKSCRALQKKGDKGMNLICSQIERSEDERYWRYGSGPAKCGPEYRVGSFFGQRGARWCHL